MDENQFHVAFEEALESALSKFDALDFYFASGMRVPEIAKMLAEEMQNDMDFIPMLAAPQREENLLPLIKRAVGMVHGEWKKNNSVETDKVKAIRDNPLPWPSIDHYPDWVFNQIKNYRCAEHVDKPDARRLLESTLLETPLITVSTKYDGTCFGKIDTGMLVGRRTLLGKNCEAYQQTSTVVAKNCDVEALRIELSLMLNIELLEGSVCVWGELMCNPGFYGYQERGLTEKWLCFGVVIQLPPVPEETLSSISQLLTQRDMVHSLSGNGRLRLLLCPSLRLLLKQTTGCDVVDETMQNVTHADMVTVAAAELAAGCTEGLVLVIPCRSVSGQASVRKWKNSAEGCGVSKKHAHLLRSLDTKRMVLEDGLHPRIASMVETMIEVAETNTTPIKIGRSQVRRYRGGTI